MNEEKGSFWALIPCPLLMDKHVSDGAKMLYLYISGLLNTQGFCTDTNAFLAERMGVSETSISRYVALLANRGYVSMTVEPNRETGGNTRKISPVISGGMSSNLTRGMSSIDGGCTQNCGGDIRNFDESTINSNNKKKIEKEKTPKQEATDALLSACEGAGAPVVEAMNRFLAMRKEIGKPVRSKQAATMLWNKLTALSKGNAPMMVMLLDTATERQWLSLYAPRTDDVPETPTRRVDTGGVRFL